jgi:hypothetical protein
MTALLDRALPRFDFSARHAITVAAPPAHVVAVVDRLDFREARLTRLLMRLRGMPVPDALGLDGLAQLGFVRLPGGAGNELVLGLIGRFWKLSGDLQRVTAAQFLAFDRPGYAKAAWGFVAEPQGGGTRLTTETRVLCLCADSRRRFARYWRLIRPASGLIRRDILRALAAQAMP